MRPKFEIRLIKEKPTGRVKLSPTPTHFKVKNFITICIFVSYEIKREFPSQSSFPDLY